MSIDLSRVLKRTGLVFIQRAFGAGLAFLLNVAIGRLLGASDAGLYFLALSIVTIASVTARIGLENTVLRFVSSYAGAGEWGKVRGTLRYALTWSGGASIALSLIAFVGAPWIADGIFDTPALAPILAVIGLSILSVNVMTLSSEALKGLSMAQNSTIVSSVLYPLLALAILWPAIFLFGAIGAALAYLGGTVIAAVIGLRIWKRAMATKAGSIEAVDPGQMRQSSRPLWTTMIINRALRPWLPLFLLGILGTTTDVGIMGAATRIVMLVSFLLIAVNTVVAPHFTTMYEKNELHRMSRLASKISGVVTLVSMPVFLLFFFAGDFVMSLFGPDFAAGETVLAVLTVGQMTNALTGPVGVILMMTGFEKDMRKASLLSLALLAITAVFTIPTWGGYGAALATTISVAAGNTISVIYVRLRIGYWVLPFISIGKVAVK